MKNLTDAELKEIYREIQCSDNCKKYKWVSILNYTGHDNLLKFLLKGSFWNQEEKAVIRRLVGKNEKVNDWRFVKKDLHKEHLDILISRENICYNRV